MLEAAADLLRGRHRGVVDAYLAAWVDDIDNGLQHWWNIGNAFPRACSTPTPGARTRTRSAARPARRRDSRPAAHCEDGVGSVGTFLDVLGESITTADPHLLSMLGFPDFVAAGIELVDELFDAIDAFDRLPGAVREGARRVQEVIEDMLLDAVSESSAFDVELLREILKNPAAWLDGPGTPGAAPAAARHLQ